MTTHQPIRTYRAFMAGESAAQRLRNAGRAAAIAGLSMTRSPTRRSDWVRFPYYHHVFDDERAGFERQIRYFKTIGEIIGIDDAIEMISSRAPIDGRYICITFDDGFKNWIENAVPILAAENAVAAFFVATGYIGTDIDTDRDRLLAFYDDGERLMEFLTWDDCRVMTEAGMTIGSHSVGHVHLKDLSDQDAMGELVRSREAIERGTGVPCRHFCCPFGRAGIDYDPDRHPAMAADAGYASFLTGHRGANRTGASAFDIRRDHLLANWGNYQLRYFLGD
ncbi:MAG: polysaccharide deacetylase family protein [Rhodospirillales bacterium]|nr:polysaccharide deacetylase family protein [Rhodospirillales bacterium]